MSLSANAAQTNYSLNIQFDGKTPKVNLSILPQLKRNDFVLINWVGDTKVARILDIIDGKVHVCWYLRKSNLPDELELVDDDGEPIELNEDHEVVENGVTSDNIDKKSILCKCKVIPAYPRDPVVTILGTHQSRKKEMYVCRFKLVKRTVYKLQPISWTREELNSEDDIDETCTEGETDGPDLSDVLRNIRLSERKRERSENDENPSKLTVTPIKILNGDSVHKVKRSAKVNDVEVSPTKRARRVVERNGNYLRDSPKSSVDRKQSHNNKARKNLNTSFSEFDMDNDESAEETDSYIVDTVDSDKSMKMKFRKNSAAPLKELHDNVHDSPNSRNLHKEVLKKSMRPDYSTIRPDVEATTPAASSRRSILKTDSDKVVKTPKRSVVIREATKEIISDSPDRSAPSRMNTRRSTRLSSINASAMISVHAEDQSPEIAKAPPKTPRTPRTPKTPRLKSVQEGQTPKSGRRSSAVPKTPTSVLTPQRTRQLFRSGGLTPSIQSRESAVSTEQSGYEMIRERLHVSAVPDSLPCRESEFQSIFSFVQDKINDECGGCIYISGVPGTGKTATVTQVVRKLQTEAKRNAMPKFDYVEINGMRLTEPRQAYVQIYRQLTGKTLAWAQARDLLEKRFTDPKSMSKKQTRPTILLIDELDIICNRKQDVVYNLFDWTSKRGSRLVAITIANTMDLPERVLKLKVASRLGLTRITFQPYTFKQLHQVVMARLAGSDNFVSDAVQLVARKVASVSGDCRRALDICRRATEIAEEKNAKNQTVSFEHVNMALNEMFASPRIRAIKCCTKFEKLFLQAVASEITRTGIEEVDFLGVYAQLQILAPVLGIKKPPNQSAALQISLALGASRLLIVEDSQADIYQKIILNVSVDDLYYALNGS